MLEKLQGIRTYATLLIIGALGLLIQVQTSCLSDPSIAEACSHIPMKYLGTAVTILTVLAGWFRKLAGTGK